MNLSNLFASVPVMASGHACVRRDGRVRRHARDGVMRVAARAVGCAALCVLLLGPAAPVAAQEPERGVFAEGGLGFLSVLSSAIYGPVKVIYATAGTLTAGFAYVLSGGELSERLLSRSLRGDYVLTPAHLTGQEPIEFVGRDVTSEQPTYETY
jgi:hypothetical protein